MRNCRMQASCSLNYALVCRRLDSWWANLDGSVHSGSLAFYWYWWLYKGMFNHKSANAGGEVETYQAQRLRVN